MSRLGIKFIIKKIHNISNPIRVIAFFFALIFIRLLVINILENILKIPTEPIIYPIFFKSKPFT